ncbi:SMC_prok_A: chromosome segregation protein SMC [Prevotella melaninogenica]|uniref:hypothetical protein n=1 Tax=Prevotella melaninogenica TaxID=28132 RepID=UPI00195CFFED|nr:hypothetical protein [Prevotella melaninogenica]VTY04611.1 SMC_prok_A: chromosome segregation protein SMC [Prevotella melaninogenica]
MKTKTIEDIEGKLVDIKNSLDAFRKYHRDNATDMNALSYGGESEYSLNGLVCGVRNIVRDLEFLTKSHNLFIKLSSSNDRASILSHLANLYSYIQNRNTSSIATEIDSLKTILRPYNIRTRQESFVEFNTAIDDLTRKANALQDEIDKVQESLSNSESMYSKMEDEEKKYQNLLNSLEKKKDSFISDFETFKTEVSDFRDLASNAIANEKQVKDKLDSVKSAEEIFNTFIRKIDDREVQLEGQNEKTNSYQEKLTSFSKQHSESLEEISKLIEKSKQALQYTTAAGISAAFQTQYEDAKDHWNTLPWLIASVSFLVLTIGIGSWIVGGWWIDTTNAQEHLYSLIGRLSMLPLTITASIFCANQYIKQKNIIEDYAYKAVLSKSIIAFSEELRKKDDNEYSEYISTVLKEIHQDPLRKRSKSKEEMSLKEGNPTLEVISKLEELLKIIVKTKTIE